MDLASPGDFFLAILPAMIANGSPVAFRRFLGGKGWHPIDGGRVFIDGKRLLGDGKTVEGFLLGILAGIATAVIIAGLRGELSYMVAGALTSIGALVGDLVGSFLKRRLGLERGAPAPVLDQLDFYLGALAFLELGGYRISVVWAASFALLVIILHVTTNYIAYRVGLKEVPW